MKLRPPNLIHFSNKWLDELNTSFAWDLYNEDLPKEGHMISQDGIKYQKLQKL